MSVGGLLALGNVRHNYAIILLGKMNIPVARQAKSATKEATTKEKKNKSKRGVRLIFGKELVRLIVYFW